MNEVVPVASNEAETRNDNGKSDANVKIIQRNYTLNDVGALKKKLKHELTRKQDYCLSKEAKNAANVVVQMRTSFFEFTKSKFVQHLRENSEILDIKNIQSAKAPTDTSGDAFVEYSVEIVFKADPNVFTIKLTAYTTTCQLMIQPVGEQIGVKSSLGNRGSPLYFVDAFLFPWCQKVIDEKIFNEKISSSLINALSDEIKRLESLKCQKKKQAKHVNSNGEVLDVKCISKNCTFQGLNPNNKAAVGNCSLCGGFEHFSCAKIKTGHKEDILSGLMKFYCSVCFSGNPLTEDRPRGRLDSLPIFSQGYLPKNNCKAQDLEAITYVGDNSTVQNTNQISNEECVIDLEIESIEPVDAEVLTKCDHCEFAGSQEDLLAHNKEKHELDCDHCEKKWISKELLDIHLEREHNIQCDECDETLTSKEKLNSHKTERHTNDTQDEIRFKCQICDVVHESEQELKEHTKNEHYNHCLKCKLAFQTTTLLHAHLRKDHNRSIENEHPPFFCPLCNSNIQDVKREDHVKSLHKNMCYLCLTDCGNEDAVKKHIDNSHLYVCDVCDFEGSSVSEMEDHILEMHGKPDPDGFYRCDECSFMSKDKNDFGKHFKQLHGSQTGQNSSVDCTNDDYRALKHNYERLQQLYRETVEELKKQKSVYEVKLIEANENFSATKAENEALKEKIDVLFKLGREYLNGKKTNGSSAKDESNKIIDIRENSEEAADLQEWTSQKLHGFSRKKDPSETNSKKQETSQSSLNERGNVAEKPYVSNRGRENLNKARDPPSPSRNKQRTRFCHYFVNEGKCKFEDRTGERCKFEHKIAPLCNFGTNCRRHKCMFSHPRVASPAFLERNPPRTVQMPMMNPWFHPPVQNQQYYPNPWETNYHVHQRSQN